MAHSFVHRWIAKHHTHVANQTNVIVKVTLTDKNNRSTSQRVPPGEVCTVETIRGPLTVFAYKENDSTAEAEYTAESDMSFIIQDIEGKLNMVPSIYGYIHEPDVLFGQTNIK